MQLSAETSPEALEEKYRLEREKRMRADADAQYLELEAAGDEPVHDPYSPPLQRDPIVREVEVAIIGAGFGGMLAAARLREAGIQDFLILDKAGDFGGTWYWNRYPGAACDIESYIYMPLLEETGYVPTENYAKATEIFAYCQQVGRAYDLYSRTLFQTQTTGVVWDDAHSRWNVHTNRGDILSARFLVVAAGMLHKAKLPGIPGVETFTGHSFHSSRWDYDYTGGGPSGGLTKLADKRVGIIGTGATAIQAVPHLAASASQLFVFQRTPSSVGPRGNRPTDPTWARSLTPGWQRRRMENFMAIVSGKKQDEDLVQDGWTEIMFYEPDNPNLPLDQLMAQRRLRDFRLMDAIRRRVDDIVEDRGTAEALKPWYDPLCKRPGFHDEYLQAFNRPNVTLVDTDGRGVDRINPNGIVVGDREYPLDCIIYASGFEVMTDYTRRIGFDMVGRGGVSLARRWQRGVHSLFGLHSHCFPNMVLMSATQGGWSVNVMHMLDEQARHVARFVSDCRARGARTAEPSEQAEDQWLETILVHRAEAQAFQTACTPGYQNAEGRVDERFNRNNAFMGGTEKFLEILKDWRSTGMPGMEFAS